MPTVLPIRCPVLAAPAARFAVAAAALAVAASAGAADISAPPGVVNLNASASTEVPKDTMTVVLTATREGSDAAAVQTALKQALDTALTEARRAARPQALEVQTGNFSLYPRYAPKGGIAGWQGNAELVIEGRDMPAIGALIGRITTLAISRVGYGLSREQREKVEGEVTAQAIARFRARAAEVAKAFGYAGYTLRDVAVSGNEQPPMQPVPMLAARAMASASVEAPLPTEAGKAAVAVTVSGAVQLVK